MGFRVKTLTNKEKTFFTVTFRKYLDSLAEEINDGLQEKGHVTITELTKQYDLPAEFLVNVSDIILLMSLCINPLPNKF